MKDLLNKFKIPTLLGFAVILLGITAGVFLTLREQIFLSKAAPDLTPREITLTNLTSESVTISWQTNSPASSFLTFGQNSPGEQTVLDDRDTLKPQPRLLHYVTLKHLLPKTKYQFKIVSGKTASEAQNFETVQPLTDEAGFTPVIGSALDNNAPLNEGIAYLSLSGAVTQSALIKPGGNFLIPLSQVTKADLSGAYLLEEDLNVKLTIFSGQGEANATLKLKANLPPLPPIKIGQNIDLIIPEKTPEPTPTASELSEYDLNSDGRINAADNAIILQNFGKKLKDQKADLNSDGKVDQKDLNLMSQKLTELGSQ